jgi:hypothetical protein
MYRVALSLTVAAILVAIPAFFPSSLLAQESISRPGPADKPTTIHMAVVIIDVDNVDGAEQSFDANVYYEVRWRDERLVQEQPGDRHFKIGEIWTPRIILSNEQRTWRTMPEIYEVSPNGEVTYTQRIWGSFSQQLVLRDFPFDTQQFEITFVSTRFGQSEVKLVSDPNFSTVISDRLSVPSWRLLSTSIDLSPYKIVAEEAGQPAFTFSFTAQRIANYYLIFMVLPLVLILGMSWIVFWIDATEMSLRFGLASTSMLTLIAYRFAMASELPNISYLTRMDIFMVGSTVLVFLALLAVAISSRLVHHDRVELARVINRASRYAFPGVFAVLAGASFFT